MSLVTTITMDRRIHQSSSCHLPSQIFNLNGQIFSFNGRFGELCGVLGLEKLFEGFANFYPIDKGGQWKKRNYVGF